MFAEREGERHHHGAAADVEHIKRMLLAADTESAATRYYISEEELHIFKIRNNDVRRAVVEEVNMLVDIMLHIMNDI